MISVRFQTQVHILYCTGTKSYAQYIPIGDESCTLSRFIGSMIRKFSFAPIDYTSWKEMPTEKKTEMCDVIESKFEFVPYKDENDEEITEDILQKQLEVAKSWVFKHMSGKWRQWKNYLKSIGFDTSKTIDEMVKELPDSRVDKDQYKKLVGYWCSEKSKKISIINQANRLKLEEPHCTGTKSFARIMDEKSKDADGIPLSRAQMYILSRTKKDGTIVSEKATEVVEQMKKQMNEFANSSNKKGWSWENDVYAKVKGPEKRGRVRCIGDVYASSSKSGSLTQRNEEVISLKAYVNGLEQKIELQSQVINQQSQVLATVISLLNKRFPEENVNDVIGEVNQLIKRLQMLIVHQITLLI